MCRLSCLAVVADFGPCRLRAHGLRDPALALNGACDKDISIMSLARAPLCDSFGIKLPTFKFPLVNPDGPECVQP